MDQQAIRYLKRKYCSLAVKKQIDALKKGNQLPKISILTALSMLTKAWNSIPDGTFTNYFKKSGISEIPIEKALNDEDDPFASLHVEEDVMESLKDDLEMMKEKFHENYGMTAEELLDIDFEISVTSALSDADIIAEISGHVDTDEEEESVDEEQPTDCISKPLFKDVMDTVTILEDYSLFSNFGANLIKALKDEDCAFDFDCKHFNKKKDKKKKRTRCFLIPQSL